MHLEGDLQSLSYIHKHYIHKHKYIYSNVPLFNIIKLVNRESVISVIKIELNIQNVSGNF